MLKWGNYDVDRDIKQLEFSIKMNKFFYWFWICGAPVFVVLGFMNLIEKDWLMAVIDFMVVGIAIWNVKKNLPKELAYSERELKRAKEIKELLN